MYSAWYFIPSGSLYKDQSTPHFSRPDLARSYSFADHTLRFPVSSIAQMWHDIRHWQLPCFLFQQESCWTLSKRSAANALRHKRLTSGKLPISSSPTSPNSGRKWCRNTILRGNMQMDLNSFCREPKCAWRQRLSGFSGSQTFHVQSISAACRSAVQIPSIFGWCVVIGLRLLDAVLERWTVILWER